MKYILRGIGVLLLLVSLAMLVLPCWTVKEENISALEYISSPADYANLTKEFREITDAKKLTTRNALPIFALFALNCVTIVVSLLIRKRTFPLMTVVVGAASIFVYATNVLVKAGKFAPFGVVLGIVLIVVGLLDLLIELQESVEE